MLHIVIEFQVAAWLEAHQCHADFVKLFDLAHLLLRDLHLLFTDRVECAHFLSVKRLTGLFADEPLSAAKLLVIYSVDSLYARFFGRND